MKAGTVVKLALALLVAAGVTYAVKPELFNDYLPESLIGKTNKKTKPAIKTIGIVKGDEWIDCAKVRDKVGAAIAEKLPNPTPESVAEFIKSPENRLLLAQWVIADADLRCQEEMQKRSATLSEDLEKQKKQLADKKALIAEGAEIPAALAWDIKKIEKNIDRLEKEIKSARLLSESAAGKGGAKLMGIIGGSPDWAWQFAFTGECVRPGIALSILKKISKDNPDMVTDSMVRDIATATALEYAKSNWNQQDAVERANFYIESWKDDRLNTVFDTLPMWQRRMVCGCKGDNPYGSLSSLRWAQDNMRLPADRYSGACWRCAYRLNNIYGDSIHGPLYYAPFESNLGDNRAAMTYHIGGVCGSLSHFGAFSALANGVPAMTSGEPAHCSYIVLVGDTWTPAYSLSWDRGLHWQVFRDVYSYSALHSASELYSAEQKGATESSIAWRVLGSVKAAAGDLAQATDCYEKAAKAQPRHWMAWREWREALEKSEAATADHWTKLNDTICANLVPLYPEMAYEHMRLGIAEGMAKALNPEQLRAAFFKFWQNIKTMGPDRWHIERLANLQMEKLGISTKTADPLCQFYADLLKTLGGNSEYLPAVLAWSNEVGKKLDAKTSSQFMQTMISSIAANSSIAAKDRLTLVTPAILSAEKNRDMTAFRAIADMVAATGHKNTEIKMPKVEPFPGKLASEGGMICVSTTAKWDKPYEHPSVLTANGGEIHTDKETDPYVIVEMPRQVHITGIALVSSPGNRHRQNNMKIQVSDNGKDWTDVYQFGPCNDRVLRSDLNGKRPVTKYVRILRPGGPEYFQLNGIYIYGEQAA